MPIALLALGCQHQSTPKTQADLADDATPPGSGEPQPKGSPPPDPVRPGVPTITYPAFQVLPDGRSVVTLTTTGTNSQVTEQKAEGKLIYFVAGVNVPYKVNRLPLETGNFATQVSRVTVSSAPGGATVVVDLREPATGSLATTKIEGGTQIAITLPKSEKWGRDGRRGQIGGPGWEDVESDGEHRRHRRSAEGNDIENAEKNESEDGKRYKRAVRQSIPWVDRHITLPYMTLMPDIGISVFGEGTNDPNVHLSSGIHWGITDHIEVELTPNTFRFSPNAAYAEPSLGATFLFFKTTVEMAGRARFFAPIDSANMNAASALLGLSLPVWIHLGHVARLETGATVSIKVNKPVVSGLFEVGVTPVLEDPGIPLKIVFQPAEPLFVGVGTGLTIRDFSNVKSSTFLPLGAQIGITASNEQHEPSADFGLRFDLPHFIAPGDPNDKVLEDTYQVAAWLRWYYYL
ncbi:MAG: hypothetical protein U0414_11690 [Polyangiaceae bacterium]